MSDESNKVIKLLSEREIKDSMADAKFYEKMPEFLPLRAKMQAMHDDLVSPNGCTSCAKNRVFRNLGDDYLAVVSRLSGESAARMREYFGADELRARIIDPVTKQPKSIKI